jgi:hypothetical protein
MRKIARVTIPQLLAAAAVLLIGKVTLSVVSGYAPNLSW